MAKNVAFTICAKNYLAQALTLQESFKKYNNEADFYIYLSDAVAGEKLPEVVTMDESWIPNWESMAFKYDVIEFSTSIKPFSINHLFNKGYDKVVYLDPDICVFNSLDVVYGSLDDKSIMLTPHRCELIVNYEGPISECTVSNVGVYNLGFIGLRNDKVGQSVTKWWMERLAYYCYNSTVEGMFVDQKWMDFVPGFYPNDVLISQNLGLNVALWNIQERVVYKKGDKFYVKSLITEGREDELVFYHFSGFNPETPHKIDKRHDEYTITQYPDMKGLLDYYAEREFANEYKRYRAMKYSFNEFSNGTLILPIDRRMYRANESMLSTYKDLFSENGALYKLLKENKLISKFKNTGGGVYKKQDNSRAKSKIKKLMCFVLSCFGVDRYVKLQQFGKHIGNNDNINFLVK